MVLGQALQTGSIAECPLKAGQIEAGLHCHRAQRLRLAQALAVLVPFAQQGPVVAAESFFALAPRSLGTPEGTQRRSIALLLPVIDCQRLVPDLPGVFLVVIYLVQREKSPGDIKGTRQRLFNTIEPLRGPIDEGSHIVAVNVKFNHVLLSSPDFGFVRS
jgi:hypothetical protein